MSEQAATTRLTHIDDSGAARMVDVSAKEVTAREAVAAGRVDVSGEVVRLLRADGVPKGDALGVARIAGIMGAKRTADLIPLCHPLSLSSVEVDLVLADDSIEITATVRTADRTGVEMEALTAVCVAALAVVDMVKAVDRAAVISDVMVVAKSGGRSGTWVRHRQATSGDDVVDGEDDQTVGVPEAAATEAAATEAGDVEAAATGAAATKAADVEAAATGAADVRGGAT